MGTGESILGGKNPEKEQHVFGGEEEEMSRRAAREVGSHVTKPYQIYERDLERKESCR